jgi:transposase
MNYGLKYTDDKWDSFWLAHMLRLEILPEGYIYPREERPLRDLLRKRLKLVREKTSHILSLKSMICRNLGINIPGNNVNKLREEDDEELFDQPQMVMRAKVSISIIQSLSKHIDAIKKEVVSKIGLKKAFHCLLSVPGIGDTLELTIMLEVGDINRFEKVSDYSSFIA